jgi:hypothetical protein
MTLKKIVQVIENVVSLAFSFAVFSVNIIDLSFDLLYFVVSLLLLLLLLVLLLLLLLVVLLLLLLLLLLNVVVEKLHFATNSVLNAAFSCRWRAAVH